MKGYSIHVGVNRISETHYKKNYIPLTAPGWDAERMRLIAQREGFMPIATLLNETATRYNFLLNIELASRKMKSDEVLLITFSGHGSSFSESDDSEPVQAICLYDWMLREDELLVSLNELFNRKTKIIFISDSCHSGGFLEVQNISKESTEIKISNQRVKSLPEEHYELIFSRELYQEKWKDLGLDKNPTAKITINHLSACLQKEKALEEEGEYSLFTEALYRVWNMSRHTHSNYERFIASVKKHLQSLDPVNPQSPNFKQLGLPNSNFINRRPF